MKKVGAAPRKQWNPTPGESPANIAAIYLWFQNNCPSKAGNIYCLNGFFNKLNTSLIAFVGATEKDREISIDRLKAHTGSCHSRVNLLKGICIILDPTNGCNTDAGMKDVFEKIPRDAYLFWLDTKVLFERALIKDQKEKTSIEILSLPTCWNTLEEHYAKVPASERHKKAEVILRFYLQYWPCRDDLWNVMLVQNETECSDPQYNYVICEDITRIDDWTMPIYFYLHRGKTVSAEAPIKREITRHLYADDNLTGQFGINFGRSFRYYLQFGADVKTVKFTYGDILFGKTSLTYLSKKEAANIFGVDFAGGFINYNRKMWEAFGQEDERNYGKIIRYSMHSAATAAESYDRITIKSSQE